MVFANTNGTLTFAKRKHNTMLGNFEYYNPTKLYFGNESLNFLAGELKNYGPVVMLSYGGGSIKRNGIYDSVVSILKAAGKTVVEDPGVMPNPTLEKLRDGVEIARNNHVDLILAVGGGSVCDYAKGVAASVNCEEDPWEKYYLRQEEPSCKVLPVGCVLTMVGTGSEMNGGSVITNHATKQKIGKVFGSELMPKFAVLNPEFTFSIPQYQMVAGIFDIMSHLMEQYFSDTDDNTTDYLIEGLMRSLIQSSMVAVRDPRNYEARSNIMWTATWALNTLLKKGKTTDWEVHMIGHAVGAHTGATHGMTLSAVSLPYYRYIMPYGREKFVRFATEIWGVHVCGCHGNAQFDVETRNAIALKGLEVMEAWMKQLGVATSLTSIGVTEDMIESIADSTVLGGGYKQLTREEVVKILRESL